MEWLHSSPLGIATVFHGRPRFFSAYFEARGSDARTNRIRIPMPASKPSYDDGGDLFRSMHNAYQTHLRGRTRRYLGLKILKAIRLAHVIFHLSSWRHNPRSMSRSTDKTSSTYAHTSRPRRVTNVNYFAEQDLMYAFTLQKLRSEDLDRAC
jgi:hypothetical protein